MTETGGGATTSSATDGTELGARCIGRPRDGMDFRIVDDAGRDVAMGTPGEFLVRADGADPRRGFFSGYLKDEAATEEAWAGGWFHTGDVVTADAAGLLYFFDRKKSIVRRSGENIGVLEVEAALAADRAIKAAAVTAAPDEIRGEEVFRLCRPGGRTPRPNRGRRSPRRSCAPVRRRSPITRRRGYVAFVDQLPLSSTQKLQRGEIKAMAARRVAAGEAFDFAGTQGPATRGAKVESPRAQGGEKEMSVRRPTEAEIAAAAARVHLSLDHEGVAEFTEMVGATMEALYAPLDAIPD